MVRPILIIVFSINYNISDIGLPTTNNRNLLKSRNVQNQKEKSYAKVNIREIGKTILLLGSNVCTITERQYERKIRLKRVIGEAQADFIILIETNLEADWNPYPQIYDEFRTENSKNCGVLILAKKILLPILVDKWENKGLCIFSKILGITIIGIYTPYHNDFEIGKKLIIKWIEKKKWIAFGDNEHMIKQFAKYGEFNYIPEYSRDVNGNKSLTDGFYGNLFINDGKINYKICDHYILTCKIEQGYKITKPIQPDYKRKEILFWVLKKNSKLYKRIIENWPKTPLSGLLNNLVKKRKIRKSIWIPNINYDATKIKISKFKENYYKSTEEIILHSIKSNNLQKLAKITRNILKINKRTQFIEGTTNENGEKLMEEDANNYFTDFYRNLFEKSITVTSNSAKTYNQTQLISRQKNESYDIISKLPGMHKAMGYDNCPDEITTNETLLKLLHNWASNKMNGENLEPIYNIGKLVLLSKNSSPYPTPKETRPIIIFSIVRKYLERLWLDKYGTLLWSTIGKHQGGFRKGHGTQELIVNLCNWLEVNKKGAIAIFIDVKKAFDSVERYQVFECVKNAGVDEIGLQVLHELLDNTILIFKKREICYRKGVPQGSVLSPVLFNMVYEIILKEAVNKGWFVQAYADDLVIGLTNIDEYSSVLRWIDSWKEKVYLEVNNNKTKEFRIGKYRNTRGRYETVPEFKYLGAVIYSSRIRQCAKSRCQKQIKSTMKLQFLLSWTNHKTNYLCLIWWLASYIIYTTIHGIVCDLYSIEFITMEIVKAVRKVSNAPPRMSNEILLEFYALNIKNILETVANKIKLKLGIIKSYNRKDKTDYDLVWRQTVSQRKISPKLFTSYYSETAWKGKTKLFCKFCEKGASLCHLYDHQKLTEQTYMFFKNVRECGIYRTLEKMNLKEEDGKKKLGEILDEAEKTKEIMMKDYIKIIK